MTEQHLRVKTLQNQTSMLRHNAHSAVHYHKINQFIIRLLNKIHGHEILDSNHFGTLPVYYLKASAKDKTIHYSHASNKMNTAILQY